MGFYLASFRFSFKRIFFFTLIGTPIVYLHSRIGRQSFMAKLREKEQTRVLQLADARNQFKEMKRGASYSDFFTRVDYQLEELEGQYKLIVFGDFQLFQRLVNELKRKLSSQKVNFYCVLDRKDQELLEKLSADPEKYQKDQTILVADRVEKEYFLLNEDQEVLLYDQLERVAKDYTTKITALMKAKINKDIEIRLMKKLKF